MSLLAYRGKSRIDQKPIVAVISGKEGSKNSKTGDMAQLTIIPDNEFTPLQNQLNGGDKSVCGSCIHRPRLQEDGSYKLGTCYVNTGQGTNQIYYSLQRGNVKPLSDDVSLDKPIRLGAYGEPTSLPLTVLKRVAKMATAWTGYTHRWRQVKNQAYRFFMMASCDSPEEREEAKALGWRTFRVRKPGEPLLEGEIECPASEASGKRLTCAECLACRGTLKGGRNMDVSIEVHGLDWKKRLFEKGNQ